MGIDLSELTLEQATPWTPEEELAEAKAHGFDTVEAWLEYLDAAMQEAE